MLELALEASSYVLARAGEMFASKEGCLDDGHILRHETWFYFGAFLKMIIQCRVRLVASRLGFGAQKGINCGTER